MAYELVKLTHTRGLDAVDLNSPRLGSGNQEIGRHFLAIRKKVKSFTPISRLPTEVLLLVFSWLAHGPESLDTKWSWVRVTHVCNEWRSVALGCPLLWARLYHNHFKNSTRLRTFLNRAKGVPLTISYNDSEPGGTRCPESIQNLQLVLQFAGLCRIRVLEISISESSEPDRIALSETIHRALYFPAPCLKRLSVIVSKNIPHINLLPPSPFADRPPPLEEFSVERSRLSWKFFFLKNLTSLHLKDLHDKDRPTLPLLLSVLKKSPRLDDLVLNKIGPIRMNFKEVFQQNRVVELPCLRNLHLIYLSAHDCVSLLDCLVLPADVGWYIQCNPYKYQEAIIDSLLHTIIPFPSQKCISTADIAVCEKLIVAVDHQSIGIEALTSTRRSQNSRTQASTISFDDLIWCGETSRDIFNAVSSTIERQFWRDSRELCVQLKAASTPVPEDSWKRLIGCLPELQLLKCEFAQEFSARTEEQLMDALNSARSNLSDPIKHMSPKLTDLEFINANFSQDGGKFYDGVVRFLSFRRFIARQPIKSVKLKNANGLSGELADRLRQYVDIVEWDCEERSYRQSVFDVEQPEQMELLAPETMREETLHMMSGASFAIGTVIFVIILGWFYFLYRMNLD